MSKRLKFFFSFLIIVPLVACGGQSRKIHDDISMEQLLDDKLGVVVIDAATSPKDCRNAFLRLGRRVEKGYEGVTSVRLRRAKWVKSAPGLIRLTAGTYHIVSWSCPLTDQNLVISIGNEGRTIWTQAPYQRSFASFTVQAGEVVNVGRLLMNEHSNNGNSHFSHNVSFEVVNIPDPLMEGLKETFPKIYGRMKTRLMQLTNAALPATR